MTDNNIFRLRSALRGAPEKEDGAAGILPADCPVTPLGKEGGTHYYLDALGQLRALMTKDHSRNGFADLFAPFNAYLETHWPRYNKEGEVVGFRPEQVTDLLMQACGARGVWSPFAKVRGRGAWRGADGDLILHLGRRLWIVSSGSSGARHTVERPGERGGYVYPVYAERPGPHPDAQSGGHGGAGDELLTMLRTWHWERPALDPILLLGWICAAMLGGALHWRPACWITGDKGTGKSTLQDLVKQLLVEGEGVYVSSDATAASLRQFVRHDSLPVALDEAESEEDNTRLNNLIALARQASSGGVILRGGSDHSGHSFIARFSILYSSILIPPLRPQDVSRIAVLNLRQLNGGKPPMLQPEALRLAGQRLLRRLADGWHQLQDRLDTWRGALLAAGYDARGADQFGTLLACADVALHDHAPDTDTLDELVSELAQTTRAERAEEVPDWARCLQHIITTMPPVGGLREQRTLGTWLAIAANRAVLRDELDGKLVERRPTRQEREQAQDVLAASGMRFELAKRTDGSPELDPAGEWEGTLAVANSHAQLQAVFDGTHWAARSGAAGVWRQTLERVPGSMKGAPVWFRGIKARTTLVPVRHVLTGGSPSDE